MSKKLFVGNLSWGLKDENLHSLFSEFGQVEEAKVITDRMSGRSKGFGFVTFVNAEDADNAIAAMHEKEVDGRPMIVNEARPMQPRN